MEFWHRGNAYLGTLNIVVGEILEQYTTLVNQMFMESAELQNGGHASILLSFQFDGERLVIW